jgi:hypothetical protein
MGVQSDSRESVLLLAIVNRLQTIIIIIIIIIIIVFLRTS